MSIIIKGMNMPNECRECPLEMYLNTGETRCYATNSVLAAEYKTINFEGRPKDCPIEEVKDQQGHWVGIDDEPCETWECDRCGYIEECEDGRQSNVCPRCGADMRRNDG